MGYTVQSEQSHTTGSMWKLQKRSNNTRSDWLPIANIMFLVSLLCFSARQRRRYGLKNIHAFCVKQLRVLILADDQIGWRKSTLLPVWMTTCRTNRPTAERLIWFRTKNIRTYGILEGSSRVAGMGLRELQTLSEIGTARHASCSLSRAAFQI